jgi:hypothetical protein
MELTGLEGAGVGGPLHSWELLVVGIGAHVSCHFLLHFTQLGYDLVYLTDVVV